MDTPIIALYYRESDPMKRKMFLDQSIAAGEEEEANAIRKELWEIRYGGKSEVPDTPADGYLALWMVLWIFQMDLLKRRMELDPSHLHVLQLFQLLDHILTVRVKAAE